MGQHPSPHLQPRRHSPSPSPQQPERRREHSLTAKAVEASGQREAERG